MHPRAAMDSNEMSTLYNIGPLQLDPEARVLTQDGAAVALGARAVAVLAALVSRAGEYVQKEAILDAAWPGLVVEEANLAVQISAIRRALARVPDGEGWIETLARRGYRFVGPVTAIAGRSAAPVLADRRRTNLPELLTSFVGRERELAELKQLLPTIRLLTLTGTGGIGKTRLAQQAAAEMLDAYRDGVWFVDLAPLGDPTLVPSALAQVLQVKEAAGQPLLTVLCNHLQTKEILLILDNCEHVLDACARFVAVLLRETAQVTVIATSREPLHLAAEHPYPVAALPLPDPKADAQSIARSDAVQLFVERARQYRPHFGLQEQRAHAVAEICVRLDGIPLALELAAARVAVLPVEQIVRLLDQRFRLLTSGNRELPRHQTLHAMIDWSYELLDEAEKALFARLSVFAGGWTLAAAEAVCGGDPIAKDEVVYVLIGLIEQSLVVADEDGDRYRMLDTIRYFAIEKLGQALDCEEVRNRHLEFYVVFAEHAERYLFGASQVEWLTHLDDELDNILAAHSWCEHASIGRELDLRLTAATRPFWLMRGLLRLGLQVSTEALKRGGPATLDATTAGSLIAVSQLAQRIGDNKEAELHAQLGLEIARQIQRGDLSSLALSTLAGIARENIDFIGARRYLDAALPLARELGRGMRLAGVLNALADLERTEGKLEAAIPLYEEALAISRDQRAGEFVAVVLVHLSIALSLRSENERATLLLAEAIRLVDQIGAKVVGSVALNYEVILAASQDEWTEAARYYGASEAHREAISYHLEPYDEAIIRRSIDATAKALGRSTFDTYVAIGRRLSYKGALSEAAAWLTDSTDS